MKQLFSLQITLLIPLFIGLGFIASGQEWQAATAFPDQERDHPVGFAIGQKAYISTGWYEDANGDPFILSDFYSYDVNNDSWQNQNGFPGASRGFSIGVSHQGKGYLGFGLGVNGYLNDLWQYDTATGQWQQLPDCPCDGRRHPAMEAIDGKIYVGLGDNRNRGNLKDWWVFDIDKNQWNQIPDLPGPARHHPYHFTVNGNLYAGMGHGSRGAPASSSDGVLKDWYKWNPKDSTWTQMNNFPGESRVAGTQFSYKGKGYILSGDGADHGYMDSGEFWQYDPDADSWKELPAHPGVSIWAPTNFVADSSVYLTGGLNRKTGERQADLWRYNFGKDTTSQDDDSGDNDTTSSIAHKENTKLNVYPNPTQSKLNIPGSLQAQEFAIVNTDGKTLKTFSGDTRQIDVADIPEGIYILRIQKADKQEQTRFIKQ